jgi:hypothetical protein
VSGPAEGIGRSGNPFVDWGLSVMAAMCGVESIEELTPGHLKAVTRLLESDVGIAGVSDLEGTKALETMRQRGIERLSFQAHRLKCFFQAFTGNTPLHNPKPPKGRGPTQKNIGRYFEERLTAMADLIGRGAGGCLCCSCGKRRSVGLQQVGQLFLGRDWFPLAGAATESNLASAGSSCPAFCPECLLAVTFIPYAVLLVRGKVTILQSSPPEFAERFARGVYEQVQAQLSAGQMETLGQGEGTKALTRRLLDVLQVLHLQAKREQVDPKTRLFAWYFSNTGSEKPQKEETVWIEEMPNAALLFLKEVVTRGLRQEVEQLLVSAGKETDERPGFLRCVEHGREYPGLYPRGRYPGASLDLFELYQLRVIGRRPGTLRSARVLAERLLAGIKKKNARDAICKADALYEREHRTRARRIMVEQALEGAFTLEDYRDIFCKTADSSSNGRSTEIDTTAWRIISFYLGRVNPSSAGGGPGHSAAVLDAPGSGSSDPIDVITRMADVMFDRLLAIRDSDWIRGALLREFSPTWFNAQYVQCARSQEGFTYERWLRFSFDQAGRYSPWESLYQVRLRMAWRLAARSRLPGEAARDDIQAGIFDGAELPLALMETMGPYLSQYLRDRGAKRVERDLVSRWTRGEIGFDWLAARLRHVAAENDEARATLENWLSQPPSAGRWVQRHQLGLALVNAARRLCSTDAG